MSESAASTNFHENLVKSLSKARFDSYRTDGKADFDALCKYVWNLLLCESLYPGFQILEVAFRNSVHAEISKCAKDANWLINEIGFLLEDEKTSVQKARQIIKERGKALTEDVLIAEMSFGFWTSLLDSRYEIMWHKIAKDVFPNMPNSLRTRKDASRLMNVVRKLRNAALHHHSIWHWGDLMEQHDKMEELIGHISNSSLVVFRKIDRFPQIYSDGYKQCEQLLQGIDK